MALPLGSVQPVSRMVRLGTAMKLDNWWRIALNVGVEWGLIAKIINAFQIPHPLLNVLTGLLLKTAQHHPESHGTVTITGNSWRIVLFVGVMQGITANIMESVSHILPDALTGLLSEIVQHHPESHGTVICMVN